MHIPLKPPAKPSTAIAGFAYDPATRTLYLQFKSAKQEGTTHTFHDVPPEVADGLASADSAGRYYAAHIKGKFGTNPAPEAAAAAS